MSDPDLGEARRRHRRWSRIRTFALVALVAVFGLTVGLVLAGDGDDDGGGAGRIPFEALQGDVTMVRVAGEPAAVVRIGALTQVHRAVTPAGDEVSWCEAGEVFVSEAGDVYDIDGVRVAGAFRAGLERLDFVLEDELVDIDPDEILEGAPAGTFASTSLDDPAVAACVAGDEPLQPPPTG